METFNAFCSKMEQKIVDSYESGITVDDAEKLAGEFLYAQMRVSAELKKADLDTRMKKTGVKSIKAAVYLESVAKADKKPSDAMLEQIVNSEQIVVNTVSLFDQAEAQLNDLDRFYHVFREAHVYFRGIAKGRFE